MQNETLIGYRLVRLLGSGSRAEVFLAVPAEGDGDPVALKVPLPGTTESSILVEAEALDRAAGDHVVGLLDLATGPFDTPVLVLARLTGPSVAQLLARRGRLEVSEAITVLAPLHAALTRLHARGVAHGRVGADAVLFAADGTPVLARFGRATLVPPDRSEAALDADAAVSADRGAFRALADQLLGGAGVDLELDDWPQLPTRLFALATPTAVDLDAAVGPAGSSTAIDPVLRRPDALSLPDHEHPRVSLLDRLPMRLRTRVAAAAALLRPVRRRTWMMAAIAVGGLALAITVVGALPTESTEPTGLGESGEPGMAPTPSGAAAPASADPSSALDSTLSGDDPVAALVALLRTRQRCLDERSVLCLDAVGQPGSAALADDQLLVRELQQGAEIPAPFTVTRDDLILEERLGDSALLVVIDPADSEPASVLLMKGEAGWRIRGYLG